MRKIIKFKKEYYLQIVTNEHLKELFDLELVTSEFQFQGKRFDGLAYDKKSKSFVIIEYKNKKDFKVLNQAKTYYDLLQKIPKEYINRYNEEFDASLQEKDIHFEKTKVMIISSEFTKDQIKKSENPDYPFELYLATLYQCDEENGCITYEKVNGDFNKRLKIKLEDLEITEEKLLKDKSPEMIELYKNLKDRVLNEFGDVSIHFQVNQFSFRVNDNLLCVIIFLKSSFTISLYGKNDKYKLKYCSDDDFDYFLDLFKQVYEQKV